MKSHTIDHLKHKVTPTLGGIFETQYHSLLEKVYAYINNKEKWSSAFISSHGPTAGRYRKITFEEIQGEFNVYNQKTQQEVLTRVNQYITDFESAKFFPPSQESYERLLEVRNYFQDHIKEKVNNESYLRHSF